MTTQNEPMPEPYSLFPVTDEEREQMYFERDTEVVLRCQVEALLNDDEEMRELFYDYLTDLAPTLTSLARNFDTDTAFELHKQLVNLARARAKTP